MAAGIALLCAAAAAAPLSNQKLAAAATTLEPELAASFAKTKAPGMAVGLVAGGELIWFKAYGVRDVAAKAPVDDQSVFRIASMTKAFVSAAVLRLRDEGKLSLDEPAEKYLPELKALKYPTRDSPKITVRHLLSHAAGLPEDNASADLRMPMTDAEFGAVLARGLSFSAAPGTQFEYANLGFALAGRLVSRVAGESVQNYITKNVVQPVGMPATSFGAGPIPDEHRARGYGRKSSPMPASGLTKYDDDEFHEEPAIADGSWAAIGGLWTSPRDYAKWVAFQLGAWPPRDDAESGPVRRASLRETQTLARPAGLTVARDGKGALQASAGGYGLGWGVAQTCRFDQVVAHSGGLPGYGSYVVLLPDRGVAAFAMTNLTYTPGAQGVRDLLEGLDRLGLIPKRKPAASAALLAARDGIVQLYAKFDEALLGRIADRTYLVYDPPARLARQLESLRARHGACKATEHVEPENALRGKATLACERGKLELEFTLTSEVPPLLQSMALASVLPAGEELSGLATRALALGGHWDDAAAEKLFGKGLDRAATKAGLVALAQEAGACRLAEAKESDGATTARFALACDKGKAELNLALDEAGGGRLGKLSVHAVHEGRCPR